MARSALLYILVAVIALSFVPRVAAFGAGNIPSYSYLEDKAFRHGDIEDILATMAKALGGGFLSRSHKFTGLDVKRVYFGNWLRDYSQAVDVGTLQKVPLQTILNVVMVLGFLAHGYATAEFQVTKERLGVYLPTEHIDNPKGYAEGQDARHLDPRLRGPIDPRELEIDPRTGMKNYIANESGGWATSSALVRETLIRCIEMGRRYRQTGNEADSYEAFRLLGQALHTLEDFTAHSNFCELSLISMGNQNVFPHVGRNVKIRNPRGQEVYPLVTGTFGGADFIHSLMGEATDHLSSASVSDLTKSMTEARTIEAGRSESSRALRSAFIDLPGGGNDLSREMNDVDNIRATTQDPSTMSPEELYQTVWKVLCFRDSVSKKIENTLEKIPGLSSLTEKISSSLAVFVMTTIEPFVKPLLGQATQALQTSSQAVIDSHDQYEVWNDWNSSDPTHSFLSKDHFALLLNEPAGQIAKLIVQYTVQRVVTAWDDNNVNPRQTADDVLNCLFHPDFSNGSQIQVLMLEHMRKWFDSKGGDKHEIINRLSSDNVKAGKNKRIGDNSSGHDDHSHGSLPDGGLQGVLAQHNIHVPGAQYLNMGQDLAGGKMPWQQGFGSGGAQAWRSGPDGGAPPQGQHNQPPSGYQPHGQQQYGGGNQGFNAPPHGPPSGYQPQQQQYGQQNFPPQQQQYGQPPSGYQPQGGHQGHQHPPGQQHQWGDGVFNPGGQHPPEGGRW